MSSSLRNIVISDLKLSKMVNNFFYFSESTRVMIFSSYRESVYEITEVLAAHEEIKSMAFVGQSTTGTGGRKSVSQKEQLNVIFHPFIIYNLK